ncbi:asparagine synthase-related protein [Pseudoalteromonas tunicata]|uniref:asparagine synthase (glutamine-hydrolyzing) n=1 Tax=Pseudoalteromonas tunicata D2 TaxID=87626 RepID=A4C658_9GAMM|nr:asparagine synthase-related protein [Pseudoalteromonas tunicata]ATC95435.1 hypothetical protein PTUN_a3044 [Pseudoalteromonas tunicata]AXT31012.1 hypothetical protein D1819_09550 [Pseudoalteromonas tunicata]EAR29462.1 hypothetical protein PTD2_11619 [Pseudoalteromonas tunicata D2]
MSDFLLGQNSVYPLEHATDNRFTDHANLFTLKTDNVGLSMSRNDSSELWQPSFDEKSQTHLFVLGRPVLAKKDLAFAQTLNLSGGLVGRFLLHHWLNQPQSFSQVLNGYFAVIIICAQKVTLFTDKLGIYNVYQAKNQPKLMLSSHPDNLASWLHQECTTPSLNHLAVAEVLATGSSFDQACFYNEITVLKPASHYTFELNAAGFTEQQTSYWSEIQVESNMSQLEWSKKIACAISTAMQKRTHSFIKSSALLLSGGADSRSILFSHPQPSKLTTITFCDSLNLEAKTAQKLAQIASSDHHTYFREFDHYALGFDESIRVSGGMWSIKDAHYHQFGNKLIDTKWDSLLTGCYTDYLLKGLAFNKQAKKCLGRPLPLYQASQTQASFYQPHFQLGDEWQSKVRHSINRYFDFEQCTVQQLEDKRIRPLYREADAMGRLYLMRCTPWDPLFCDNEIIDIYRTMPKAHKLNYRTFADAVQMLLPKAAQKVPNNNHGGRLNASETMIKLHFFSRRVKFKLIRHFKELFKHSKSISTHNSWPDFATYLQHSQLFQDRWYAISEPSRNVINHIMGQDLWQKPFCDWNEDNHDLLLRAITIGLWLDQRAKQIKINQIA